MPSPSQTKPWGDFDSTSPEREPSTRRTRPRCYHFIPDPHFMRIRRTLPIVLAVVAIAAAVTLAVELRKDAPPESARLLPGADAFLYADLGWARRANSGKLLFPVSHDPEYERFIQETGFDFDRDLDAVAFAVH